MIFECPGIISSELLILGSKLSIWPLAKSLIVTFADAGGEKDVVVGVGGVGVVVVGVGGVVVVGVGVVVVSAGAGAMMVVGVTPFLYESQSNVRFVFVLKKCRFDTGAGFARNVMVVEYFLLGFICVSVTV